MEWHAGEGTLCAYGTKHCYLVITEENAVRLFRFSYLDVRPAVVAREAAESTIIFPLGRGPGRPGGAPELAALASAAKVYAERYEAGESLPGYPSWTAAFAVHQAEPGEQDGDYGPMVYRDDWSSRHNSQGFRSPDEFLDVTLREAGAHWLHEFPKGPDDRD